MDNIIQWSVNIMETASLSPVFNPSKRMANASVVMTLDVVAQHEMDICRSSLVAFTTAIYKVYPASSLWVNVDGHTGRILIPTPWGNSKGAKQWNLYPLEAECLRYIMLEHSSQLDKPSPYRFSTDSRWWCLDMENFPSLELAMFWIRDKSINLTQWASTKQDARNRRTQWSAKRPHRSRKKKPKSIVSNL